MKVCNLLFIFIFSLPLYALESPFAAYVFHYKGDVRLSTAQGEFGEIEKGEAVAEGDVIKTGERSFAIIRFPDKSTMRVDPNSEIQIEKLVERVEQTSLGSSDIILRAGNAVIDVINKSKAPVFNVRTKDVAMGVRGTRFLAGIDPQTGHTELAVDRGEVEITHIDRPDMSDAVDAGYAIHLENGRDFTQPQKYNWVKKFNFNANDKNFDYSKSDFVHDEKRREFREKRKKWKRDPKRWSERKEKWRKLRGAYLGRAEELKEKRKEFRTKKNEFREKREGLISKRNQLIKETRLLRKETETLRKDKLLLLREAQSLKSGRKDPRRKMDLARKRKAINSKTEILKKKRKGLAGEKKKLSKEKKLLLKESKITKKNIRKIKKKQKKDQLRMLKMKKKMKRMRRLNKMKQIQQQNTAPTDGAATGG